MKFYRLLTLTTSVALWLSASSTKAQNPYESLGVKVEPLTLSKGKYIEFFDKETIVQIGTVLFNTETNQVVAFLRTDTLYSESNLSPEIISRWLSPDPLAKERSEWTPYNYCSNNPILRIDPDGALDGDYYTMNGKYQGTDGIDDKKVYTTTEQTASSSKDANGAIDAEKAQSSGDTKYIGQQSDLVNMGSHTITSERLKQSLTGFSIYLGNQSGGSFTQITVTGGDRSASRNAAVGGASKSSHIDGIAADIKVNGISNESLSLKAGASGLFGGVIFYPNAGDTKGFGKGYTQKLPAHTHVDMRTSSYQGRYIGHDGKKNRYSPWISNTQIR